MQGCVHFNVGLDNCCACHMLQAEEGVEVAVGEGAAEGWSKKKTGGRQEGREVGS